MEINKIYNIDCRTIDIPDESVDLVTTDPPYNLGYNGRGDVDSFDTFANDELSNREYIKFAEDVCHLLYDKMKPNAHIYLCIDWRRYDIWYNVMKKFFKIPSLIIWNKKSIGLGLFSFRPQHEFIIFGFKGEGKPEFAQDISAVSDVWDVSRDSNYAHPTQKPVELFRRMIKYSSKEGNLIFDPFGGSGASFVACSELKRNYIGTEIDKNYYDKILERLKGKGEVLSKWF